MWNLIEINFIYYKIYILNRIFVKEYFIWGMMIEYIVIDLIFGGIYNVIVYRVRGSVEGFGIFIRVVVGIYIFFDILKFIFILYIV